MVSSFQINVFSFVAFESTYSRSNRFGCSDLRTDCEHRHQTAHNARGICASIETKTEVVLGRDVFIRFKTGVLKFMLGLWSVFYFISMVKVSNAFCILSKKCPY